MLTILCKSIALSIEIGGEPLINFVFAWCKCYKRNGQVNIDSDSEFRNNSSLNVLQFIRMYVYVCVFVFVRLREKECVCVFCVPRNVMLNEFFFSPYCTQSTLLRKMFIKCISYIAFRATQLKWFLENINCSCVCMNSNVNWWVLNKKQT